MSVPWRENRGEERTVRYGVVKPSARTNHVNGPEIRSDSVGFQRLGNRTAMFVLQRNVTATALIFQRRADGEVVFSAGGRHA